MAEYSHLTSISVKGRVTSSTQGNLIGSSNVLPAPSDTNKGVLVLFTGDGPYEKGKYYQSTGTEWVKSDASAAEIIVDDILNAESANPIANKAVAGAISEVNSTIGTDDTTSGTIRYRVAQLESALNEESSGLKTRIEAIEGAPYASEGYVDDAVKAAVASVYRPKGSVPAYANLPSNATIGDVYDVASAYGSVPAGTNWVWDGEKWDALAGITDLSAYSTSEQIASTYATKTELTEGLATKQDAITVSTSEPTPEVGTDGALWVTYE